ncbi:MAG: hypothetical protein JSR36_14050 [Proteobacteria bacterium]|nr:hypothetical protein [Pseudomonadota bacterium]
MPLKSGQFGWLIVGIWGFVALLDTVHGDPVRDAVLIVLAAMVTVLALSKTRLHFSLMQRLFFLPALTWAMFISYALLLSGVEALLPKGHAFLWLPFIGWSAAISAPVVAAVYGTVSVLLMQRDAILITTASAGLVGLLSISATHTRYLYPYTEALWLVGTVFTATVLVSRVLLTNYWNGHETIT